MTLLPSLATFLQGARVDRALSVGSGCRPHSQRLDPAPDRGESRRRSHADAPASHGPDHVLSGLAGDAHDDAWTALRALNVGRLALTGSYNVKARCPAVPVPLGRDASSKRWRYTLDVNFSLPYSAAI